MKLKIYTILFLFTILLQAQVGSRNEKILKESSGLIYENAHEAQRLLSFVNHTNSEVNYRVLSLLILADAAYLKADFVAAMNFVYQAEELVKAEDTELKYLIQIYLAKYYRILGFNDLSDTYLKNINRQELPEIYNLKAHLKLEESIISKDSDEKLKHLKSGSNQIDTVAVFGNALKYEFQLRLAELFIQMNLNDSADKYISNLIKSGNNVFSARAYLLNGLDLQKADSLLKLNPDVISQLALHQKLAEANAGSDTNLYRENIISGNEIEEMISQSKIKARDLVIAHIENQKNNEPETANYIILVFVILILVCVGGIYYYLKTRRDYKRFLKVMEKNLAAQKEKSIRSNIIPEKTEQLLLKKLEKFEQSQKFIQPDISLTGLAKSLNTNTKYLSDIINRNKGCNFNQYINDMRINYIIEKMKSEPKYLNYKMIFLAEECGFSSQSSFSTVFKSVTGISPLSFIKFLKNEIKAG